MGPGSYRDKAGAGIEPVRVKAVPMSGRQFRAIFTLEPTFECGSVAACVTRGGAG